MKKLVLSIIFVVLSILVLAAPPKREVRALWMATVGNIDWPSRKGLSVAEQKAEFIRKIDMAQAMGINTLIVQVRPAADAFYQSSYEPWSQYLTGKQGQAPNPFYDPLQFMIDEAHKRNMELHAWFNPYRALVNSKYNPNPANHVTRTRPDWLIHFDGKTYFDPGNPEARAYIIKVLMEVVEKYDIDGLHIDDYFYPYPVKGKVFNDATTYQKSGSGLSLEDWRRQNVNTFVQQLYKQIKKKKPWVKFGVSPFGIWRNQNKDPEGSATNGTSCYDDLYSDVRLWMRQNWVDYMMPQLYWERGHRVADYTTLLDWWSRNQYQRDLVIGLGVYKMVGATSGVWSSASEILGQIQDGRAKKVKGFAFYSQVSFEKIGSDLFNELRKPEYFGCIAIPHPMPWIDSISPTAPENLKAVVKDGLLHISWNKHADHHRFLIYRFKKGQKIDFDDASKIVKLTSQHTFTIKPEPNDVFYVRALDRMWNESVPGMEIPATGLVKY